jgi:hypothetical protein
MILLSFYARIKVMIEDNKPTFQELLGNAPLEKALAQLRGAIEGLPQQPDTQITHPLLSNAAIQKPSGKREL